MNSSGYLFAFDSVSKFHKSIFVHGWLHHPADQLKAITLRSPLLVSEVSEINIPHGGVSNLGPNKGFTLQALLSENAFDENLSVRIETKNGWSTVVRLLDATVSAASSTSQLNERFRQALANGTTLLDIGGRARSDLDYSKTFPDQEVTVLDILPDDNVDVVGDAHNLSAYFEPNTFDAVFSCAVFEHLLMPWKVAIEMNKVMKLGAIGFINTHQTLGMHDLPWDFWRFSDAAWKSIFNKNTGFEIVETAMDSPQYVIPFCFRPEKADAEKSVGFEASAVMFKKTGQCSEVWRTTISEIDTTVYPE